MFWQFYAGKLISNYERVINYMIQKT
jgi:hypothetical protein